MTIIAGTGHRPDKLGGYKKHVTDKLEFLAECELKSRPEYPRGELRVISGMALGWDTALAVAALRLNIPLIAAVPFRGFSSKWPDESRRLYTDILNKAVYVHVVCADGYDPIKMQHRNIWMVDNSDEILALWNGTPGGTANCLKYADFRQKPVTNLWDKFK